MNLVHPEYNKSIVNIMASIMGKYKVKSDYITIKELDTYLEKDYTNVVLLVFDGFGAKAIERHLDSGSFTRRHQIDSIQSVYPPTTTAAMTSYYSGLSPLEHGWLGWSLYFKEYARTIDLFTNRDSYTGKDFYDERAVYGILPYSTVYQKMYGAQGDKLEIHTIKPREVYFPSNPNIHHGVDTMTDMRDRIIEVCKGDRKKFIASYWPQPDTDMHKTGPYSLEVKNKFQEINSIIESLAGELENTLVIVSADHGQLPVGKEINLAEHKGISECFSAAPALESRALAFYIHHNRKGQFEREFKSLCGDEFILYSKEEVYDCNLFGFGTKHGKIDDFIGDYLACATSNTVLLFKTINGKEPPHNKGHHGGLTEEEMLIPLIVFDG